MSYVAPSIGIAGLTLPLYQDILDDLIAQKKSIYGEDIYLGEDTTDYQELSTFALMIYDTLQAVQLAYNSRSPLTAIGSGLDGVIKINGILRQSSSYSSVDVLIEGTVGTVIVNGSVKDAAGQVWNLPATVTIPPGGYITVTATAAATGDIQALAGTITKIVTPQSGWLSVSNPTAATPGTAVETDAQLRIRQRISTAIAAISPMDSLMGTVAEVAGVSRIKGYENDTNETDTNGLPPHSVCVVVEGGDSTAIAEAIAMQKTLGTATYGDTTIPVLDYKDNSIDISFYRVIEVPIQVKVTITALFGYLATIGDAIVAAVADCINATEIGNDVYLTRIIAAASLYGTEDAKTFNITAVEIGRESGSPPSWGSPPTAASDVVIAFNETAVCYLDASPSNVELEVY